jgi:hypothetical protein
MPPDRPSEHEPERAPDPGRARDLARIVTLLGIRLLMPPAVTLFVTDARIGGMPLIVAYLFAVWLALIGCARLLAHRLEPQPDPSRGSVTPASTDAGPMARRDSPPR